MIRPDLNRLYDTCPRDSDLWSMTDPHTGQEYRFDFKPGVLVYLLHDTSDLNREIASFLAISRNENLVQCHKLTLIRRQWVFLQGGPCESYETPDGKKITFNVKEVTQTKTGHPDLNVNYNFKILDLPSFFAEYIETDFLKTAKPSTLEYMASFSKDLQDITTLFTTKHL